MNFGFPQFCAISSQGYMLYTLNHQLLQSGSFHSHTHHVVKQSNKNQKEFFLQGLASKRVALDEEVEKLRGEHRILSDLIHGTIHPQSLKPFITRESQPSSIQKHLSCSLSLVSVDSNQSLLLVSCSSPQTFLGFFRQKQTFIYSSVLQNTRVFWMDANLMDIPFYLYYSCQDHPVVREIHLQRVKKGSFQDFPRLLFSSQYQLPFDGYLSSTIQYRTIYTSIAKSLEMDLKGKERLDFISMHSTYDLILQTFHALLDEIAFLKEEMNVRLDIES